MNPNRSSPSLIERELHRRRALAVLTRRAPDSDTFSLTDAASTTSGSADAHLAYIFKNSSPFEHLPLRPLSPLDLDWSGSSSHRTSTSARSSSSYSSGRPLYPQWLGSTSRVPNGALPTRFPEFEEFVENLTRPVDRVLETQRTDEHKTELDYQQRVERNAIIQVALEGELEALEREEREEKEEQKRKEEEERKMKAKESKEDSFSRTAWHQMFSEHIKNEAELRGRIVRRSQTGATATSTTPRSASAVAPRTTSRVPSGSSVSSSLSSSSSLASFALESRTLPSFSPGRAPSGSNPHHRFADSTNTVTLRDSSRWHLRERRLAEIKHLGKYMDDLVIPGPQNDAQASTSAQYCDSLSEKMDASPGISDEGSY